MNCRFCNTEWTDETTGDASFKLILFDILELPGDSSIRGVALSVRNLTETWSDAAVVIVPVIVALSVSGSIGSVTNQPVLLRSIYNKREALFLVDLKGKLLFFSDV